jgi:hypothetical protein
VKEVWKGDDDDRKEDEDEDRQSTIGLVQQQYPHLVNT